MINIITIHDCEFNIIYANEDAKRILRLPFIGREKAKCYDYFHDNGHVPDVCAGLKCFLRSEAFRIKIFEPHLNKFLYIRATPLYGTRKEPIGIFHVAREMKYSNESEEISSESVGVIP
jgi:hypothetical protein